MHAIYHYLLHLDPVDGKSPDIAALDAFMQYGDEYLDENNWWAPIDLVMKDGGYYHDFDGEVSDRFSAAPEPIPWDAAIRFALDCVVSDLRIRDQPFLSLQGETEEQGKDREAYARLSFPEVLAFVHNEVPKRLVEAYQKLIGQPWAPNPAKFDLESYQRAKLSRQYELFRNSTVVPFTTNVKSPYEYRAYDLTESYAGGEPNAILRLDIHT